ncbi:MAG TPA: MBL fold metallo-hydrolase [Acidimicrobiia bacterium]|nr:MBL fold metallo-hydrolase [Acidimicrobiia bacterium]
MIRIDRVLANNPGPFTGPGTNTWLLDDGLGQLVVIDPGPIDDRHREAIESAVRDRSVVSVLVTHTHVDHAPMANPLARDLGVPAMGHGAGPGFDPDLRLGDRGMVSFGVASIEVIHTPGHSEDHLCFRVEDVLFTGDHIMGGSSVMVESMGPYLDSLEKVRGTGLRRLHPGHGAEMEDPDLVIDWYLAHRLQRHEQIFEAIKAGADTPEAIVDTVYSDVSSPLQALALRSVLAHLTLLTEQGRIAFDHGDIAIASPKAP